MSFDRQREHAHRIAPRDVLCDLCAGTVRQLEHGSLLLHFDVDGRVVAVGLYHTSCAAARARQVDGGESAEIVRARDIDADARSRLRGLARTHDGASISRILGKLARLSRGASR